MLSTAIIIFREVFEIVLILGIVLAATRGIEGRMKWISGGVIAGLLGSATVAVFTDQISNIFNGVGQEILNASILFTASLLIGATVIWMHKHGKEMKAKMNHVGMSIAEGEIAHISLSIIIALAILREGSEIVLFMYSMLLVGKSTADLISGSLIGLVSGTVIGLAIYYGLLKMSTKYFFKVTSWLLILLVVGMVSQATGFLVAAGYFEGLSEVVWDSSALISDRSAIGQLLQALVGYTSHPTKIQLLLCAITLFGIVSLIKWIDCKEKNKKTLA